jgi:proteasome lid subunit RPN8/RPN11
MVLDRVLLTAAPLEGCALLLGKHQQRDLLLQRIWPCCNRWEPAEEQHQRFRLDPREQLLAQRWGRAHGLQVIGSAHSHPSSGAVPSTTDLQLCCGPTLMLIRSGRPGAMPEGRGVEGASRLRAWWIPDDAGWDSDPAGFSPVPRELAIALDDDTPTAVPGHLGE